MPFLTSVERVDSHDRVIGVVSRRDAFREGWLIRVATTICRDRKGRFLVYRRPDDAPWFAGFYEVSFGGAVNVGESYLAAAERELAEELGVSVPVKPLFTYLCPSVLGAYWLGVHEAVITEEITASPQEIAWYGWLTEAELAQRLGQWQFIPDGQDAFARYRAQAAL